MSWQEIPGKVPSVVLESVDVEVDGGVDGGEEVGELHRVLHPGGPHKISLDKMINKVFIPQYSYLRSCFLLQLIYVRNPPDTVAEDEH